MFHTVTVQTLVDYSEQLFRSFGFRADNPTWEFSNLEQRMTGGFVTVTWANEAATGQAAFSQVMVQASMRIWRQEFDDMGENISVLHAGECNNITVLSEYKLSDEVLADMAVTLELKYTHHDHGSNGIRRLFKVDRMGYRLIEVEN